VKHIVETVVERYRQRLESGEIQPVIADDPSEYLKIEGEQQKTLTGYEDINKVIDLLKESLKFPSNNATKTKAKVREVIELLEAKER
jgi:hypothetical protein